MAVTAIAAIGGLALGAAKFISSANQQKKDRAKAERMRRPYLKVQDEYFQNRNIAEQLATSGLPIDVTNQLARQRAQGLTTSLDALKQVSGSPNAFAALNKSFSDSLLNESSLNAQQQLKNIEYFMSVNKDIAGQRTTQFGVNELQPYQNDLKQLNERLAASEQNKWQGASEAIGSLSAIGTQYTNARLMNKLFSNGSGGISDPYTALPSSPNELQPVTNIATPDVAGSAPEPSPLSLNFPNSINADVN
jgi:hypothetical protein